MESTKPSYQSEKSNAEPSSTSVGSSRPSSESSDFTEAQRWSFESQSPFPSQSGTASSKSSEFIEGQRWSFASELTSPSSPPPASPEQHRSQNKFSGKRSCVESSGSDSNLKRRRRSPPPYSDSSSDRSDVLYHSDDEDYIEAGFRAICVNKEELQMFGYTS